MVVSVVQFHIPNDGGYFVFFSKVYLPFFPLNQEDEVPKDTTACEAESGPSITASNSTCRVSNSETARMEYAGHHNRNRVLMAIFVAVLSWLAIYLWNKNPLLFDHF